MVSLAIATALPPLRCPQGRLYRLRRWLRPLLAIAWSFPVLMNEFDGHGAFSGGTGEPLD